LRGTLQDITKPHPVARFRTTIFEPNLRLVDR
jgi:hypothetical protein